jgi:hypothetical protein
MIKCGPGNADAGWLGQALQPRSYVNAVAEDVIFLYNNIDALRRRMRRSPGAVQSLQIRTDP